MVFESNEHEIVHLKQALGTLEDKKEAELQIKYDNMNQYYTQRLEKEMDDKQCTRPHPPNLRLKKMADLRLEAEIEMLHMDNDMVQDELKTQRRQNRTTLAINAANAKQDLADEVKHLNADHEFEIALKDTCIEVMKSNMDQMSIDATRAKDAAIVLEENVMIRGKQVVERDITIKAMQSKMESMRAESNKLKENVLTLNEKVYFFEKQVCI